MKDEFLVVEHNMLLRILYLKCITLFKLKDYFNKNNKLTHMLKENNKLNTYLDNQTNDEIEEVTINIDTSNDEISNNEISNEETNNDEINNDETNNDETNNDETNNDETNNIETNNIETNNSEINNIEINIRENKCKINTKIQKNKEDIFSPRNEILVDMEIDTSNDDVYANKKCIDGCNYCYNGCGLFFTGVSFACSFINYYMTKFINKIKKCVNKE